MTQQPRAALLFILLAVLIDMMTASIATITLRADRSRSRDDP